MDGGGRLAQPLKRSAGPRAAARPRSARSDRPRGGALLAALRGAGAALAQRIDRHSARLAARVAAIKPRRAGALSAALLLTVSIGYGVVRGEHVPAVVDSLVDMRDAAANAAGFKISALSISGLQRLTKPEVLAVGGVTERTSLLFLNVDTVRRKLEASPWVAQATVRKLYPGQLEILVVEREAFAVWQRDGKLWVVAEDGAVLGPWGERAMPVLPLVVGEGAAARARGFLAILDRYPQLKSELRASVLVAERRWNLRFKSGLDVRLPEQDVEQALETLLALDRDKKILSRDITSVDLRLPGRVSVRLSDEAAKARDEAAKSNKKRPVRRGGNA
jgi:cell division protein FtsQ